jgi:ABC-type dipeptide/oligopeptide/nickel transport system ATPase component
VLGIVGESGSGKSVTARAVMGLIQPPGRVASGEHPLRGRGPARPSRCRMRTDPRQARMAMIFQEPMTSLNPVFSIGDQIAEAMRRHETSAAAARRAGPRGRDADQGRHPVGRASARPTTRISCRAACASA